MSRFVSTWATVLAVALLLSGLAACDQNTKDTNEGSGQEQARTAPPLSGEDAAAELPEGHPPVEGMQNAPGGGKSPAMVAGIAYEVPSEWVDAGPAGMRVAQWSLPPVGADAEAAEVAVFYFGPASGGGVEANIDRWVGQMKAEDGGNVADEAERKTIEVDGMPVHLVSVNGTYDAGTMRPMGGGDGPKEDYRMVAAIVEGPQGSVFFKLTGPEETAKAMETGLMDLVQSLHKQG
jgi:hypothetical protein